MGLTPLSLISTFVAGLLTLRSNKGLSRLKDARNSFGEVVLHTREMAQLIGQCLYPVDHQMGLLAGKLFIAGGRKSYMLFFQMVLIR
jgi:predicted membrane chloride channel (bestrophin family)